MAGAARRRDPLPSGSRSGAGPAPTALAACCAGSTTSGSAASSSSSAVRDAARAGRGGGAAERRSSPSLGARRSPRCRPTGATSTSRSSSSRATTRARGAAALARSTRPRTASSLALRFRVARTFGYGASPGDGRALPRAPRRGRRSPAGCRILRVLSDTDPVATQGPVWYVAGAPSEVAEPISWMVVEPG